MKYFLALICFGLLASCASSPAQHRIREYIASQDFETAQGYIEDSSIKKKKKNKLLYHLEKGQLLLLAEKPLEATHEWEKAREILKDFYKKKTVDKVLNTLANNNYEDFHGEVFEQYQLFFQLSLAYIKLAQQKEIDSKTRSRYLFSARAAVVDWDSFIELINRNKKIRAFYKDSFLARFWGSLVHEMIGSRNDLQIAYELMQDAFKIKENKLDDIEIQFVGPSINKVISKSLIRQSQKLGRKSDLKKWENEFSISRDQVILNPAIIILCLLYTSPSPRDKRQSRMPSSA